MKRRVTSIIATTLALSVLFTGCSNSSEKNKKKKNRDRSSRYEREDDEDETTVATTARRRFVPTPNYLGENTPTWFESQGLTFTPTGNFMMDVYSFESFSTAPAQIRIETNYDCEEGYKNVIATTVIDISALDAHFWTSSFDKYTGTSFEFHGDATSIFNGCDIIHDGDVELNIGDYNYLLHINEHIIMEDSITTIVYTITCPEEYDGTVLQYGAHADTDDDYRDFGEGTTWLASDFTDMHGRFNYFTLQGLPQNAS